MELLKIKSIMSVNPNLRVVLLPVFSLIMLVVLVFPVFRYGYGQIAGQMERLNEKESEILKLENKLQILREVKDSVLGSMDTSLLAVPSVNPGIWKLFQVYSISTDSSVSLLKRDVDAETSKGNNIYGSKISFVIQGDFEGIFEYLENLNKYVPLFTIENVAIKKEKGSFLANVNIMVYRVPLPTELPALTQPIKRLSNSEMEMLEKLEKMKPPEFTTVDPIEPSERKDPFY
jgi:Tfp pilus assembly protein PilO